MDILDHLNERMTCGLCDRPIRYSDDFCSSCRHLVAGVPPRADHPVVLEAELLTAVAS